MQNSTGWWYVNADGSYPKDTVATIGGRVFRFDANGYMRTGWINEAGAWYYHDANGVMATGWLKLGSTWYYLDANGVWVK